MAKSIEKILQQEFVTQTDLQVIMSVGAPIAKINFNKVVKHLRKLGKEPCYTFDKVLDKEVPYRVPLHRVAEVFDLNLPIHKKPPTAMGD